MYRRRHQGPERRYRERGSEIYVERVQSVAYLYQLCPGLSNPITDRCQPPASRHLKYPGRNVTARDSVITCCVEARREQGLGLPFRPQRARIDHWFIFFLSLGLAYELDKRKTTELVEKDAGLRYSRGRRCTTSGESKVIDWSEVYCRNAIY